jgi:AcrR family transcriptional regulator
VRSAQLDAAHKLFLKHGFDRVTARQIAAAAGTTPAMIHYYFDNKLGLFRAMLDRAIRPLREMLAGSLAQDSAPMEVPDLIRAQMQTAAANAWIPPFVLNEVFAERGRFRAAFMRDIASRHLPLVIELIERGQCSGKFRADLEPRYVALSLLSLCLFPFLSRLVTEPLLGLKYEGEELDRFIAHTARLFLTGIEHRP